MSTPDTRSYSFRTYLAVIGLCAAVVVVGSALTQYTALAIVDAQSDAPSPVTRGVSGPLNALAPTADADTDTGLGN